VRPTKPLHVRSPLSSVHALIALIGCAAIAAGAAVPRAAALLARPGGARRTETDAGRRLLQAASRYGSPCYLEGGPVYARRQLPFRTGAGYCRRSLWRATVSVHGQLLELVMNDNTGHLACAFGSLESAHARPGRRAGLEVDTADEAARESLSAAHRLGIVPDGAQAALRGICERSGGAPRWYTWWRVQNRPTEAAYPVTVEIGSADGRLVSAVNGREMADGCEP